MVGCCTPFFIRFLNLVQFLTEFLQFLTRNCLIFLKFDYNLGMYC